MALLLETIHGLRFRDSLRTTKQTNHTKEKILARFSTMRHLVYQALNQNRNGQDEHDLQDKMNTFRSGRQN
jgi:hypothetical protein